jgi:hypothetical protein
MTGNEDFASLFSEFEKKQGMSHDTHIFNYKKLWVS